MKTKSVFVEDVEKNFYFCPNCHRRIIIPIKGNVNLNGSLKLKCSICNNGLLVINKKENKINE